MKNKISLLFVLAIAAFLMTACGGGKLKTEGVTGTVTLDGSPLANAVVYFNPTAEDGAQAVGKTDASGVYKLQTLLGAVDAGTTPGSYKVAITCEEVVEEGGDGKDDVTKSLIPAKYNSDATSGLTAEVAKGANTIDFQLTSN